jgi:glycosyltransferase involved in cell wall biosynthesis
VQRLNIVSVCRSLPTPDDPSAGVFVLNRLAAMSEFADVRVVQPVPYLPVTRPLPVWARAARRSLRNLPVIHAPMAYVPGVLKSLDGFWLARAIAPIVRALHAERPIDLLDAHFGYPDGVGCVRVARQLGMPAFMTLRGNELEWIRTRGVGRQLGAAMRAASGCVAVGRSLQILAEQNGVDPRQVRVVHNAIDTATFHYGPRAEARARLQLPPDRTLIVSVGHLIARKRHHLLIDAFAALKRNHPDAILAILGARSFEAQYPERLRRQVAELGLQDSVRFVGNLPQPQVVDWLRAADVFALLSAREGCCNAVLEALAAGAPVVVTDAGDNAVFVQPGINGQIVAIDDVAGATRALEEVLGRTDWNRPRIGSDLASQVGNWRIVAERVIEFFQMTLASQAAGGHPDGPLAAA